MKCPNCSRKTKSTQTKYGLRTECQPCGVWSWNGAPLTDVATHRARIAAHTAFDQLWKTGTLKRSYAYSLLARKLGITGRECHMKLMDAEMAGRVPAAVEAIKADVEAGIAEAAARINELIAKAPPLCKECRGLGELLAITISAEVNEDRPFSSLLHSARQCPHCNGKGTL